MQTPHEFQPVMLARPSYRLWEWACTCGAPCTSARTRSKVTALLGFWRDHALPDAVPPRHTCTLEEGAFENSLRWVCSCGTHGDPRGHAHERWAWQAHRAHENAALVQWYAREYLDRVEAMDDQTYLAFQAQREAQRREAEEVKMAALRRKWAEDDLRAALDDLI